MQITSSVITICIITPDNLAVNKVELKLPIYKSHSLDSVYMRGGGAKMEFIYKKLCIYTYMFKLQLPSKYSPFDARHLSRCFFHCSKQLKKFFREWVREGERKGGKY